MGEQNQQQQTNPTMSGQFQTQQGQQQVHLWDYWQVIRIRWPFLVSVFVLCVAAAVVYSLRQPSVYEGTCQLLVQPEQAQVTNIEGPYQQPEGGRGIAHQNFIQTQKELILSKRTLAKAFQKFDFASKKGFRNLAEPLKAFEGHLTVKPKRNTYLMNVSFRWTDPQLAADVANLVSKSYIEDYRERMLGFSGRSLDTLREKLVELKKSRKDAHEALIEFKKKHDLIDLEDAQDMLVERMTQLNEALINARIEKITAGATETSVEEWKSESKDAEVAVPEAANRRALASFKLEKLRSKAKKIELLQEYGSDHPAVKTREKISAAMDKAIEQEIDKAVESIRMEHERSKLKTNLLKEKIDELQDEAFALDQVASEYRLLKDSYEQTKKSYRRVLNRINEIEITKSTGKIEAGVKLQVINEAATPKNRVSPNPKRNVAMAAVLGLMLGTGLCFFRDYLDTTLKEKKDVESTLQTPVLGHMPTLDINESDIIAADKAPHDSFSEAFRTFRTSLGLSFAGRDKTMFMFTSTAPQDGKTLAALGGAMTFAREGKRVLLCELDMRRARLGRLIRDLDPNIKGTAGLSKVLIGEEKLTNIVWQHPNMSNLSIALCGAPPPNPAELLLGENFKQMLAEARENYDLVIIDSPPVLHVADASIIAAEQGMGVVFVAKMFRTDRSAAASAVEQLRKVQGDVVGTILNNAEAPRKYSRYGYYYHRYGYGYGHYGRKEDAETS